MPDAVVGVVAFVASLVPAVAVADEAPSLYELPTAEFLAQARRDIATLRRYDAGMTRVLAELARRPGIFAKDDQTPLSARERHTLASAWAALYGYGYGLEAIRQRWWDFVKVSPRDKVKHPVGYLVTHGALTTLLEHGLDFVNRTQGKRPLEILLDEANGEMGMRAGSFAAFKFKVVHVTTTTQLLTGDAYRRRVKGRLKKISGETGADVAWLLARTTAAGRAARARLKQQGVRLFLGNALDIVRDTTHAAIFPVQAGIAEWMGDVRVHRNGRPLVSRPALNALAARMQPGDIVVARQNWFLSNIGLPGFWPHAEIFLGTPRELAAYFDSDPDTTAWTRTQPGAPGTLTALLQQRAPEAWRHYRGKDEHGEPLRILEAISEGVSFTGLEHGMHVDYVGVMRPRLSKVAKAQAIARAFGYAGRPYDFDFDFFSDATLVCTELVWKSFAGKDATSGAFGIPLVEVAGRMTLPANELVRFYDRQAAGPASGRVLDFVGFLDGQEKQHRAITADEATFRASHRRVKWDVAQK